MMKSILPTALLFVSMICPASALTEADLAPAALVAKTLTFSVEYGAVPFAADGSWTGTFTDSPANGFIIKKISGATVDSNSIINFKETQYGVYTYTITPFIAGQNPGSLSLWIASGIGHYEVAIEGLYGTSQGGTFAVGAAAVVSDAPEIAVKQTPGGELVDGVSKTSFGTAKIGKTGATRIYSIKNTGTAPLLGLSISKTGAARSNFIVGALGATKLAAGASTTFKVSFKPSARGTRNAVLNIFSNDSDESPFDLQVTGFAVK